MKLSRVILTMFLVLLSLSVTFAQELTIKSFSLDRSDITASVNRRHDGNGDACALVKVLLARSGATFQSDVVGESVYAQSEYNVYMTKGAKRLDVKLDGFLPLTVKFADYGVNLLEPLTTYRLVLTLPAVGVQEKTMQKLIIDYKPMQATLLVNSKIVKAKNGHAEIELPVGNYDYVLACEGYGSSEGMIKLKPDVVGRLNLQLDKEAEPVSVGSPVTSANSSDAGDVSKPDIFNGHAYVDLGLKDAQGRTIYWATCNVGADKPEDAGLYFAWGETQGYGSNTNDGHEFDWTNYKWCRGSEKTMTKYCVDSQYGTVDNKTILDPADDAAHVNWGGGWRMPTRAEQDQLREKCTWTWDGTKKGYVVKGPNGNTIFLPAAGYRCDSYLYNAGSYGYFWSSSLYISDSSYACNLYFNSSYQGASCYGRCNGQSVRAVCVSIE